MKPQEFWDSTYREINIYAQSQLSRNLDDFKQEINLQEKVSDKLILADAMSNKRPKVISLFKTFEKLFPKQEEKFQTAQDITNKMRELMKNNIK